MSPTQSERVKKASRERRAQQKEDLRQTILTAASALLYEKGYDGFSLRQLAERIGYSATTIYLYFKDKDDLLATLVEDRFARWDAQLDAAVANIKDPLQRLRAFGLAYLEMGFSDPAFFRGTYLQRPELLASTLGDQRLQNRGRYVMEALQDAIDQGLIKPCDIAATNNALWAAVHGIVTLVVTIPRFTPEEVRVMADTLMELILKGLR